jgi:hypothetical protein
LTHSAAIEVVLHVGIIEVIVVRVHVHCARIAFL